MLHEVCNGIKTELQLCQCLIATCFFSITRDGRVDMGPGNLKIILYLVFGHLFGHCYYSPDDCCDGHASKLHFQKYW